MMVDLTLSVLHFVLMFALVGIVGAEAGLVHQEMHEMQANRVALLDRGYGAAAGLLLVVGFLRVFWGAKGADFYLQNPVFWAKIAAFVQVGALSIPPAVRFVVWQRRTRKEPGSRLLAADVRGARRLIVAQAAVLLAVPLLGGVMARGYGL